MTAGAAARARRPRRARPAPLGRAHELFELPLPPDPDVARRLRHKARSRRRRSAPGSRRRAPSTRAPIETLRGLDLRRPTCSSRSRASTSPARSARSCSSPRRRTTSSRQWKRGKERGFDTVVQELVPDSETGSGRCSPTSAGGPPACDRDGSESAAGRSIRHERGLPYRAAAARALTGLRLLEPPAPPPAHVRSPPPPPRRFKLAEVNTRCRCGPGWR